MIKNNNITVLIEALKTGLSITDSCKLARMSRDAFYKRYKKDDFKALIDNTEVEWKQSLIKTIQKASKISWTAAAWLLERKYSKEFALKQKVEHTGEDGGPMKFIVTDAKKNGNGNGK